MFNYFLIRYVMVLWCQKGVSVDKKNKQVFFSNFPTSIIISFIIIIRLLQYNISTYVVDDFFSFKIFNLTPKIDFFFARFFRFFKICMHTFDKIYILYQI